MIDIKEIALKVASELDFSGPIRISPLPDHLYVTFAEALVAEIQRQSEPIGWVHVDDVEYDGTTHSLRTINVMPSNFEKWVPIYVHPYDKTQIVDIEHVEQSVAEACAAYLSNRAKPNLEAAQVMDDSVAAIRSGEWKKFRKG